MTRVLVTGARGFIGSNLRVHLSEGHKADVVSFDRGSHPDDLSATLADVDFICHLAGENRPPQESEFERVNVGLTRQVCEAAARTNRKIPILFTSSVHVEHDNAYGRSKRAAEDVLLDYASHTGSDVYLFRLPHVVGKWCKPHYNSVVATFCHHVARGEPITINDPSAPLQIVYIDDLVERFGRLISGERPTGPFVTVTPVYPTTVGAVAELLQDFRESRETLTVERVGVGLERALYATYLSHLPSDQFSYRVAAHADARGTFVEMVKTLDSGQVSFFTAGPGVTRGGHYHHTKTEKFLVVSGDAKFRFRHVLTGQMLEVSASSSQPTIVEMIPGWAHDITNVGTRELIVMLWASEQFDAAKPDTYSAPLQ